MRTVLALAALTASLPLAAQPAIGARVGLSASAFTPHLFAEEEIRVAPAAAVFVEAPVWRALGGRAEAFYSSEGVGIGPNRSFFPGDTGSDLRADYVGGGLYATYRVPLRRLGVTLNPYAGAAAATKVRETYSARESRNDGTGTRDSDLLAPAYASVVGGVGIERGALGLDVRYALGLEDGFNRTMIVRITGSPVVRPSVVTVSATYRLGGR